MFRILVFIFVSLFLFGCGKNFSPYELKSQLQDGISLSSDKTRVFFSANEGSDVATMIEIENGFVDYSRNNQPSVENPKVGFVAVGPELSKAKILKLINTDSNQQASWGECKLFNNVYICSLQLAALFFVKSNCDGSDLATGADYRPAPGNYKISALTEGNVSVFETNVRFPSGCLPNELYSFKSVSPIPTSPSVPGDRKPASNSDLNLFYIYILTSFVLGFIFCFIFFRKKSVKMRDL